MSLVTVRIAFAFCAVPTVDVRKSMATSLAAVILPLPSTVILEYDVPVVLPKVPTLLLTVSKVVLSVTLPVPSKFCAGASTSPVIVNVLTF